MGEVPRRSDGFFRLSSSGRRWGGEEKMAEIYLTRQLTNQTLAAIGKEFGVRASGVGQVATTAEQDRGWHRPSGTSALQTDGRLSV